MTELGESFVPDAGINRPKGKLHSTTSAAKLVGVSRQAILKAIKSKRLPAKRAGGYWVITEKDLLKIEWGSY